MKILVVCGPTATGKTGLAISLAQTFHGELVSADSRQVYKGLDALTGKDRSWDIPIHLYDVVEPGEEFSVSHFVRLAEAAIADIGRRKKLPIVVGGTGFYLRALTKPFETIAIPPDWPRRRQLETLPVNTLQTLVDSTRLERMNESDRKNPRRLIRAIEVAGNTSSQRTPTYDALWLGLTAPLPIIKQRIKERIAKRFADAAHEARTGLPPILGAEALLAFSSGANTREEAFTKWTQAEYDYAKRQRLWFRKEKDIHWFDVCNTDYQYEVEALVREWYTRV